MRLSTRTLICGRWRDGECEVLVVGELPKDVVAAIEAAEYGVEASAISSHPGAYRDPDGETLSPPVGPQ